MNHLISYITRHQHLLLSFFFFWLATTHTRSKSPICVTSKTKTEWRNTGSRDSYYTWVNNIDWEHLMLLSYKSTSKKKRLLPFFFCLSKTSWHTPIHVSNKTKNNNTVCRSQANQKARQPSSFNIDQAIFFFSAHSCTSQVSLYNLQIRQKNWNGPAVYVCIEG